VKRKRALPHPIGIVESRLAKNKWLLGAKFSLADCAYYPILDVVEKAGFSFAGFPKVGAYLDALRAHPAWKEIPKLPGLWNWFRAGVGLTPGAGCVYDVVWTERASFAGVRGV